MSTIPGRPLSPAQVKLLLYLAQAVPYEWEQIKPVQRPAAVVLSRRGYAKWRWLADHGNRTEAKLTKHGYALAGTMMKEGT
jgi:hypothetical protein